MIHYSTDAKVGMYSVSYSDLREHYHSFLQMSDEEFLRKLPDAAHFACVVCWFKELGMDASVGDEGIVHELVHLMCNAYGGDSGKLNSIRERFSRLLRLD